MWHYYLIRGAIHNENSSPYPVLHPQLSLVYWSNDFSNYALAQSSFTPAIIGDDPQSLYNRLSFPNVDGDWNALVKCTAQVGESGSVRSPICFDRDETNSPFFTVVMRSARGSRMIPATVDGVNVFVETVQFSVLFQQRGEQQAIVVYPNHGNNQQFYGDNYIAAQRYGVTQSAGCNPRTLGRFSFGGICIPSALVGHNPLIA